MALPDNDQTVSRPNLAAKPYLLHAAKAQEAASNQSDMTAIKATDLGSRLTNHHPRHQRVVGHVTPHPELILRHVLVADDQASLRIQVYDRRKLHQFVPLGIVLLDHLQVEKDLGRINRGGVDQRNGRHARRSSLMPRGENNTGRWLRSRKIPSPFRRIKMYHDFLGLPRQGLSRSHTARMSCPVNPLTAPRRTPARHHDRLWLPRSGGSPVNSNLPSESERLASRSCPIGRDRSTPSPFVAGERKRTRYP